jgi:hypothetical protein
MEGARRIDEWSHIADRVPTLSAVPHLAALQEEHAAWLDLLPSEWEVLTMINGERDLRTIAALLARSEFDIAKVVYGLVSTGVVELHVPSAVSARLARMATPPVPLSIIPERPEPVESPPVEVETAPRSLSSTPTEADDLEAGFRRLRRGDFDGAVLAWKRFLGADPNGEWSERVRGGVEAATWLRGLLGARYGD